MTFDAINPCHLAVDLYASSAQEPLQQYLAYEKVILLALDINPLVFQTREESRGIVDDDVVIGDSVVEVDPEADKLLTQFTWEPTQQV